MEQTTDEQWRAVPGYEGLYEVSNEGRVWSHHKHRLMVPDRNPNGYHYLLLYKDGRRRRFTVHRLVALTFIGPRPERQEVCHQNGLRSDNRLSNLRYDTPHANNLEKWGQGTMPHGEQHASAKLTAIAVLEIRRLAAHFTQVQLAQRYGVSQQVISAIIRRKRWAWLPDPGSPTPTGGQSGT
jgi:hypothetical protein